MQICSRNVYEVLQHCQLHDRMKNDILPHGVNYTVVGGLGAHAITHALKIDWDEGIVTVDPAAELPRIRDNGTVRDLDMLVHSSNAEDITVYRGGINNIINGAMVTSIFGLRPYESNRRGILDVVGRRYITDDGHPFWRASGVETAIPPEGLRPWCVQRSGETVYTIINPVAQLGAYMNRSIAGQRPKDKEKIGDLKRVIMPSGKVSEIPKAYRDQYDAFLAQAEKMARARRRLGFVALKAKFVSMLEGQSWAVRLTQGPLDTALGRFVGK